MKRILLVLMLGVSLLTVTSCNNDTKSPVSTETIIYADTTGVDSIENYPFDTTSVDSVSVDSCEIDSIK